MNRNVVVTGGAGFIGSHLVERFLAEGDTVRVIDDLSTGVESNLAAVAAHPRLQWASSTVSACRQLKSWVADADFVFHLAAAVGVELVIHSPIRTIETNLRETECVLEAAAGAGARVIVTSTSEVYGKSQKPVFSEDDDLLIGPPTLGRWSYACSKLMDEFLALAHRRERGIRVTIARIFNTSGARQTGRYGMVLPRFVAAAQAGTALQVYGDGGQSRCFCHVADTVEALVRLAECPAAEGEVVNVGRDHPVTIAEAAERVLRLTGSASAIDCIPYSEAYAPGFEDMRVRRPAVDKLRRLTGFTACRPLEEIIGDLIAAVRFA